MERGLAVREFRNMDGSEFACQMGSVNNAPRDVIHTDDLFANCTWELSRSWWHQWGRRQEIELLSYFRGELIGLPTTVSTNDTLDLLPAGLVVTAT